MYASKKKAIKKNNLDIIITSFTNPDHSFTTTNIQALFKFLPLWPHLLFMTGLFK